MIEIIEVSKSYSGARHAVKDLNLTVQNGLVNDVE
jgi:ABC-type Na+ transport system ATPase subunit NatA